MDTTQGKVRLILLEKQQTHHKTKQLYYQSESLQPERMWSFAKNPVKYTTAPIYKELSSN